MSPEEKKDLHMKQAAEYIYYLEDAKEKIYDKEVRQNLEVLIRQFRDLRDLQY